MGLEGGEGVRRDKLRTGVLKPTWVSCKKLYHFVKFNVKQ